MLQFDSKGQLFYVAKFLPITNLTSPGANKKIICAGKKHRSSSSAVKAGVGDRFLFDSYGMLLALAMDAIMFVAEMPRSNFSALASMLAKSQWVIKMG